MWASLACRTLQAQAPTVQDSATRSPISRDSAKSITYIAELCMLGHLCFQEGDTFVSCSFPHFSFQGNSGGGKNARVSHMETLIKALCDALHQGHWPEWKRIKVASVGNNGNWNSHALLVPKGCTGKAATIPPVFKHDVVVWPRILLLDKYLKELKKQPH